MSSSPDPESFTNSFLYGEQGLSPPPLPKSYYSHYSFPSLPLSPATFDNDLDLTAKLFPAAAGVDDCNAAAPPLPPAAAAVTAADHKETTTDQELAAPRPGRRNRAADRHSKIRTAQGLRDRRMRLSVGIAGMFFALQDALGFDRASQTVGWLLAQSKPAIQLLNAPPSNAAPSSSDCGVLNASGHLKSTPPKKASSYHPTTLTKESRDKARARARERTRNKRHVQGSEAQQSMPTARDLTDGNIMNHEDNLRLSEEEEQEELMNNIMDLTGNRKGEGRGVTMTDVHEFQATSWEAYATSII